VTLAEVLFENGYATGAVVANLAYLDPHFQLDQGFSFYASRFSVDRAAPFLLDVAVFALSSIIPSARVFGYPRDLVRQTHLPYPDAGIVFNTAFRWIDQIEYQPFLLFINVMEPHSPYLAPVRFPGKSGTGRLPKVVDAEELKRFVVGGDMETLPPALEERLVALYDAEVTYVDYQVGRFLAELKARGLYDNSVVVVTSDHGEFLGEHGLVEHDFALYEEVVRIPLLVRYPNASRANRYDHLVSLADIFPTVCEQLQLAVPDSAQSASLSRTGRKVVAELYASSTLVWQFGDRFKRDMTALWSGDHKFVQDSREERTLFDLSSDPEEEQNMFLEQTELATEFNRYLNEFRERTSAYQETASSASPAPIDEKHLQRLRELGYAN
jgi:arylsulfatase A-like enzyme